MARPMKGYVQPRGARFRASVPAERGSSARVYETFPTKAQADAWCALAIAAIEAGQPVPGPEAVLPDAGLAKRKLARRDFAVPPAEPAITTQRPTRRVTMTVASVAEDWFTEIYVDGRRAEPERAAGVQSILRRHVVAFLAPILDTGAELSRARYREHLTSLALPRQATGKRGRGRPARDGYAQDVLNDIRRCLDGVLRHGIQLGAWELPFNPSDVPTPRTRRPKTPKAAAISLAETAAIAQHMHVVHQVVLWTSRILTLRLGEVYGIRCGDLVHLGDGSGRGLLWLHAQGGRSFVVNAGDETVRVGHKEGMKHHFSERMQLVPAPLMSLFDDVIAVFHTDPSTGAIDLDARLVPGLREANRGGQMAFRHALHTAATRADIAKTTVNGFERTVVGTPTPKDLRSSAVTDLEWVPGLDPTALRRYAGHAPGTDVHALHYVIDQPANAKAIALCTALESMLNAELPRGLRIPTAHSCTTRAQRNLHGRSAEIDDRLGVLGWLVSTLEDHDDSDPWLTVQETAALLGYAEGTVRRWINEGRLPAGHWGPGRSSRSHRVRQSEVVAFAQRENETITLVDIEERTGISYHRLYGWLRRFDLAHDPHGQRGISLPPATVEEILRLAELEARLQRDGMTCGQAAKALGTTPRTIAARVKLGTLDELPERGPDGLAYVKRESIAWAIRRPSILRQRSGRRS